MSIYWLNIANEVRNINYDFDGNIDVLINLSILYSTINSLKASEYCKKAIDISTNQYDYEECKYLVLLGELAISYWINGENKMALDYFENIAVRLFEVKGDVVSSLWIRVFKLTTNCLGYISYVINYEEPNVQSITKPYQGIYYRSERDFSELYNSENDYLIYTLLASFSAGIEDLHKANYWSEKAFDSSRVHNNQENFRIVSLMCNQYSIINYDFSEAFRYSLIFHVINLYNKSVSDGKILTINEISYFEMVSKKPSFEWNQSERGTLLFMILPALIVSIKDSYMIGDASINNYNKLKDTLTTYKNDASDSLLIEKTIALIDNIYYRKLSIDHLYQMGIEHKGLDGGFSIFYFYGILNQASDVRTAFVAMATIVPSVLEIFSTSKGLIDYIFAPYIKLKVLYLFKNNFIGSKTELNKIIDGINAIELRKENSIDMLIGFLVQEFKEDLPEPNMVFR